MYDSFTGNVRRFVDKTGFNSVEIRNGLIVDKPFFLVTYTIHFGSIPVKTLAFLNDNSHNLLAVASSGNRNWTPNFAVAADKISEMYQVPIIHKFELSGTQGDVDKFKKEVARFEVA